MAGVIVALTLTTAPAARADDLLRATKRLTSATLALDRLQRGPPIQARRAGGLAVVIVRRDATLADLHRAAPRAVVSAGRGLWVVRRSVFVIGGATLTVRAPQVREMRLTSTPSGFVTLAAINASLRFTGVRGRAVVVTSWDAAHHGPDQDLADGRASVSVTGRGRLDVTNTSFSYLGFAGSRHAGMLGRVSGVAAWASFPARGRNRPTGRVVRSVFHHNYFGAYTSNAFGMRWLDNRFSDNAVYGFDPHTASSGFLVEGNYAARNGRHGIIFSRLCADNVIRGNVSENNGWHGIVIDDGKLNDGASRDNLVEDNVVRANGRVGISVDGSNTTTVRDNHVTGGRYGIRVLRRSGGTRIVGNVISGQSDYGVYVDGPQRPQSGWATATTIRDNRIRHVDVGVRLRNALHSVVEGTVIEDAREHGLKLDGRVDPHTLLVANTIGGAGASPIWVSRKQKPRERGTTLHWDYPFDHDLARAGAWIVGPGVWLLIAALAGIGPLVTRPAASPSRRPRPRAGAVFCFGALTAMAAGAFVITDPTAEPLRSSAGFGPGHAAAATGDRIVLRRVVSKRGHPTHPTWYHDRQVVDRNGVITVAYDAGRAVFAAQLRDSDLRILHKTRISNTRLGGSIDSTATDTNRHDVPAVVADARGYLHFFYGGGSLAGRREDGPLYRRGKRPNSITALGPERRLRIGGGSAFDFEATRDAWGVVHLVGQRGRGFTGSLVELRVLPDSRLAPARQIIAAGSSSTPCMPGRPRRCPRFAIARLAASARGRRLHLVWGNARGSLSDRCLGGTCHSDLYYARSADGGRTWTNAAGTTRVVIGRRSIADVDARFKVVAGPVGLYKAIAFTPAGDPEIVFSEGPPTARSLYALVRRAGHWQRSVIARAGDDATNWSLALTARSTPHGMIVWVATGERIIRFSSADGRSWRREVVYRGSAFSATGIAGEHAGKELLLWRGRVSATHSYVMLGRAP